MHDVLNLKADRLQQQETILGVTSFSEKETFSGVKRLDL